jgi:hypothetical protein
MSGTAGGLNPYGMNIPTPTQYKERVFTDPITFEERRVRIPTDMSVGFQDISQPKQKLNKRLLLL